MRMTPRSFLLLMLFAASCAVCRAEEPAAISVDDGKTFEGTVKVAQLNARTGPSKSKHQVVAILARDEKVHITNFKDGWYEIKNPRYRIAWISARFITVEAGTLPATGTVTGTNVRVRSTPQIGSAIIGKRTTGDTVTVTTRQGDWYRIEFRVHDTCWVLTRYVGVGKNEDAIKATFAARAKLRGTFKKAEKRYAAEVAKERLADMDFTAVETLYAALQKEKKLTTEARELVARRRKDIEIKRYYVDKIRALREKRKKIEDPPAPKK